MLPVLRVILAQCNRPLADARILELYGEFEAEAESDPYQSYREVLQAVVRSFGERLGFKPTPAEVESLPDSVPAWPPFADTVAALARLRTRYRLAIISNIDDRMLEETRKLLKTEFDAVITAEQAKSYKPSLNNFQLALARLSLDPQRLLHVGQSIYHDVIPAQSLGIATVWVNRKSARPGVGAVRAAKGRPDLEVPDLATFAELAFGES